MKQNKLLKALLVVCSLATLSCAATGCDLFAPIPDAPQNSESTGPVEKDVYEFEGLKDVHLSATATSYDFTAGVKAYKNLEETTFNVDSSAVVFGTAGQYTVKYTVDDHEETINVYVYGNPTFTETNATITYQDAQNAVSLKKAVSAKDYFGKDLTVTVVEGISANANGYIEYGTHSVKFSATDAVGNTAEYTCNVVVSDADKPALADISIDLVDIEEVTVYEGVQLSKILLNGDVLTSNDYSFANGYLTFSESFIMGKGLGEYTLLVVTSAGYDEVTLSITDAEDAKYSLNISDMLYGSTVSFKKAVLTSNQQNITFEYALKNKAGEAVAMTDNGDTFTFTPGLETFFTLTVSAKRGTESAGVKDYPFTVQDDVYMWMVNRNNDKDAMNFVLDDAGYDYGYTTEQSFNGLGALKAEALSGGLLQILLKNVANLPHQATVYFYVYNPTGIALQAYFFNNSGYWANMGLSVCSNMADISANAGWQKVSLTLSAGFDGTFGGMSTFEPTAAQAELRIVNPDSWKWEGEGKFGVYMSNIYVETAHGMNGVSYDESNHQSTGVATLPVGLATASSTDNRHTFKYEMKKGGAVVKSASEPFAFTPDAEGEYTYTITTYWRGEVVGTKDYTISVSGTFALSTAAYYQYDNNGYVTLPAASCAISGATVVYTVTNPAGETTELLSDMTYATNGVAGTYVYTAQAIVNGEVVESETKNILIHSANVLVANGVGSTDFEGNVLNMNVGTMHSYCAEESAPGEVGSLKLDNTNRGEKGNFNLWLADTEVIGKQVITFYIKHTGSQPLDVNVYGTFSGVAQFSINFWFNGTKYTTWDNFPIQGSNEWQKVEVLLTNTIGAPVSGADIRLNFMSPSYAWGEGESPVIYLSNIYYDLPSFVTEPEEPETPELPDNLLVANGCGEENFEGDIISMNNGTAHSYCAEESAPGETGSLKLDTTNHNYGELGNFSLWLSGTDIVGKSMLTFYIKHTGTKPLDVCVYSSNTGNYVNYWYNGVRYDTWDNFPIQGSNEWQKIEVLLTNPIGTPIGGAAIQMTINSQGYAWGEGEAPVIYMSNIYYDLPAEEPEVPELPANVLVANGCGEENFEGNKMNMGTGTTFTYCAEESAPGENGSLKVDNANQNYGELGNFNFQLGSEAVGKSMITFYIKHTGTKPLDINVYGTFNGAPAFSINFWFNGTKYTTWDNFPIVASDEWQKVEVLLTDVNGNPVSGDDIRLNISSQGYAWGEGEAPVIYISNIYYS